MKLIAWLALLLLTNPDVENIKKDNIKIQFYGTVIEEMTGEPIPGATIHIKEFNQKIYTDFDGNFTIEDLIPGTYNLEVQFVSFEKKELKDLEITSESNSMLIRLN